jgi:flavin reductase (DIM6/NTAB) family NADH-FMN oxidoreductase RutF
MLANLHSRAIHRQSGCWPLETTKQPLPRTDSPAPSVTAEQLRVAMRGWPSGVTIVSACDGHDMHGMTVSSFTSVSLNPPTVLIVASGAFAVSVLNQESGDLSDRFGGRDTDHLNRFEDVPIVEAVTGAPILAAAVSFFDCEVTGAHDGGTHTIFVGRVVAAGLAEDRRPLLYWRQGYHRLGGT